MNPAQKLINLGQSIWYDNISRDLIKNGELERLISEWGVRGVTSNPSIFEKAIASSSLYDEQIKELSKTYTSADQIFEELALVDIAEAADILLPVYKESNGTDGFVSIEVSPLLASDTNGTVQEAKRLFSKLARPNIMIKIPGTKEGIPAIKEVLEEGINVNVTLLFSVENYVEVAKTYCEALRTRVSKGLEVDKIRSVASFFVSRVDTVVDERLTSVCEELSGKTGVANSKVAYKHYLEIFESDAFSDLREAGAAVQRPLWASTGTKNPDYSDVLYVDSLIGENTVNTVPHNTLEAFVDHGVATSTLVDNIDQAEVVIAKLAELDIDLSEILDDLQVKGVKQFADAFVTLNKAIEEKMG